MIDYEKFTTAATKNCATIADSAGKKRRMKMIEMFKAARRVSTPLIAVRSSDCAATQLTIAKEYQDAPLVMWDAVSGLKGMNSPGRQSVQACVGGEKPEEITSPVDMLSKAAKMQEQTILFVHNLQMFLAQADQSAALIVQAVWNLRDLFKMNRRTLVMIGSWFTFPPEINQDVVVLDEPLPTDEQLKAIVAEQHKAAKLPEPKEKEIGKAVDALRGLAAFAAEQVTAM